ncbi:MAG: 3-phosphoshikimate 1-carboxyvinyltransferase, partial [Lachnospiraceae bacterium]|nr:3-phosphoshikimate 1-carboxyvinyltransferase [Lachnospiraceae bacterium]
GELNAGKYRLPGNVSSQFVTGLLYALPLMEWESQIVLTSPLESKGYVDMTLDVLKDFGVSVENQNYERFIIPGDQWCTAREYTIEADWSQAAFWYAAIALGSQVELEGLNAFSTQGDMCIVPSFLKLKQPGDVDIDVSDCPDLVPPLAVMAAVRSGTTRLTNAARLRIKESDRLASVTQTLNALGAKVEEGPDFLKITGVDGLTGGMSIDCCNDHRIAMMAAVAATRCREPVTLRGADCVNKSYPEFWDHYRMLGGKFDVL